MKLRGFSTVILLALAGLPAMAILPMIPTAGATTSPVSCTTSQTATANTTVSIKNLQFNPDQIVVIIGVNNTVQWVNNDAVTHTVTSESGGWADGTFNQRLDPGTIFTCTFNSEGIYLYQCLIHTFMVGKISVEVPPGTPHGTFSEGSAHPPAATIGFQKPMVTLTVTDMDPKPTTPTGTVTWSDGGVGGSFSSNTCVLTLLSAATAKCSVKYTPPKVETPKGIVNVTGSYSGDSGHDASSAVVGLSLRLRNVAVGLSSTFPKVVGDPIVFKARVADVSGGVKTIPNGTISWSDGGRGGVFNSTSCTLSKLTFRSSLCAVTYTPAVSGRTAVNATYSGDVQHAQKHHASIFSPMRRVTETVIATTVSSVVHGTQITLNATVNDIGSGNRSAPEGVVTWLASRTGGSFNSVSCTLTAINATASRCSVTYTVPLTLGSVTVKATYLGDGAHKLSRQSLTLTVT